MQYKSIFTLIALIGATLAQDFSNVPKCAIPPALAAFGKTGCQPLTNYKCLCSSSALIPALESAVAAVCTPSELAQVNEFAISFCKTAGVTITIPGVSSTSGSSTSGSTSSGTSSAVTTTNSETSTTATSTSSGSTATSTMTSVSSTTSATTSPSTSVAAGGSTSATGSTGTSSSLSSTSSPSPTTSSGAGNALQVGGSALAGALLFAVVF